MIDICPREARLPASLRRFPDRVDRRAPSLREAPDPVCARSDSARDRSVRRALPPAVRQEIEEGPGDFFVDEKARQVFLTDEGFERSEELLSGAGLLLDNTTLYDVGNITLMHHVYAALLAHSLFKRNVD